MPNNAQNVSVGKPKVGGSVFRAPLGTVLPTNATDELDAAYECLGFCSDAGLTNNNSTESENIKAWGGDTVLSVQTDKQDTFNFTLLEIFSIPVLKTVYGDENVVGDLETGITVIANSTEQEEFVFVVDMILRGGVMKRIVIPDGKITNVDEISYVDNEAIGYNTTLSALPDSTENQATHYEYIQSPPSYTVTFNTDGGSAVASQTVKKNGRVAKPADPTKSGYTFDAWYADEELETLYNFQTKVTSDMTLYAKWTVKIASPGLSAVADSETLFDTPVTDIQSNVAVSDGKITGTLKHLDSGDIVDSWGAGYFVAVQLAGIDSRATSVKVGMRPTYPHGGTVPVDDDSGLVEIINDPDLNGVFKVTDKATQKFKVVSTDGTNTTTDIYDLSDLRLAEA